MKKPVLVLAFLPVCLAIFAQNALPRLAVVEFSTNNRQEKTVQDAVMVRNLVESQMIASGKYQIITRDEIDKLIENQQIVVSSISSSENVKKLQLENISYIVTGSVDAIGGDYSVTVKILDVGTGRFSHSADDFVGGSPRELFTGIRTLMAAFIAGTASRGEQVVQTRPAPPVNAPVPADMVRVEGGTFSMGGTMYDEEKPVHTVTVKGFYMGKYEVTQKEWTEVMGNNPSYFEGDNLPVEQVSWYDAVEYCNQRSVKEGLTPAYRGSGDGITWDRSANGYRLPTEAEWEYAAKGGNKDYLAYEYSGSNNVDSVGWYWDNSGERTHPVGTKTPNSLGLYDMSGNVWEWCWDWYGGYTGGAQTDPVGASSGTDRLYRGGSWGSTARGARSAYRYDDTPSDRGKHAWLPARAPLV